MTAVRSTEATLVVIVQSGLSVWRQIPRLARPSQLQASGTDAVAAHTSGRWQCSMASTVSFVTHGPADRLSATHSQPLITQYAVRSHSGATARLVCVTLSQFARSRSAAATFALGLLACRSEIGFFAPSRGLLEGFQDLPGPPCRSRKEDLAHVVTCRLAVNGNSDPWPVCYTICCRQLEYASVIRFSWPVYQPEGG